MGGVPIVQVDAFTDKPFTGNPAAICVLDAPRDDAWMQAVAAEMNLSETAYLQKREDGYSLRWFTPKREVDLCGHATLAAAHVLWEQGHVPRGTTCRFHTRSGLLTAAMEDGWIRMDFPLERCEAVAPDAAICDAIGVTPVAAALSKRLDYVLIEADSEAAVRALSPDFAALKKFSRHAFIVTARSAAPEFDIVSRFFAPSFGIDEDPVTGSAHCVLAGYWPTKLGKNIFKAFQASARGGIVNVDAAAPRCYLSGQAVTVMTAQLIGT